MVKAIAYRSAAIAGATSQAYEPLAAGRTGLDRARTPGPRSPPRIPRNSLYPLLMG